MEQSLLQALEIWSRRNGHSPALLALGERKSLSWTKLTSTVNAIAQTITATGIVQRSRIAIMLPAGPEAVTVFLSVMCTGIAVPLNPDQTATELKISLQRLRPHLVIFRSGLLSDVGQVAAALGIPTLQVDWGHDDTAGQPRFMGTAKSLLPEDGDPIAAPQETRLILQTSGTTAQPKLVPLTADNLKASAAALIRSLSLTETDRGLNLLTQYHIGGLWDMVAGPLLSGGSVICGGIFSPASFAAGCIHQPTWVQLAPAMLQSVIDQLPTPLRGVRFIRSVSAALPPSLKSKAEAVFEVPIVEIYGMTETAGVISSNPLVTNRQREGSVGVSAGTHIAIRDGSGFEQPAGTEGEVYVSGAQVSPGYIDASPEDSCSFGEHGFKTGDLGKLDSDGNLWLVGRSKDLINRGGEMISPVEVEHAILGLPGVLEAAVFTLPDLLLGEEIAAAVVLADHMAGTGIVADLKAQLRPILGHMRMPSRIFVVNSIPRTSGGKLQRHKLTERFANDNLTDIQKETLRTATGAQTWPEDILSRWVAEIWAPILDLSVMGPDEDFFANGGGSIKAAQAAAIVQDRFPGEILYVSSIYEAPTPRLQAAFLQKHYPLIAGSVVGKAIQPESKATDPVTPEMMDLFRAALVDPLPSLQPPPRRCSRAVFILGAPRSGSTLLRAMLAGHSRLFAPPELYLLSHRDLADRRAWYETAHASQLEGLPRAWMTAFGITARQAISEVAALEAQGLSMPETYRLLQEALGNRLLVDKTPYYGVHLHVLEAADVVFDDVFFIHLSRHPYGMIHSFEEARLAQLWWPRLVGGQNVPCPFHPRQLAELIWERIHSNAEAFLNRRDTVQSMHVHYEQLVSRPEATCRTIAEAIGLPYEPSMLDPLGDSGSRMTDGLLPESRMIGDPKFHSHRTIDSTSAYRWRGRYDYDFLSERTWALADRLGHGVRLENDNQREVFDV